MTATLEYRSETCEPSEGYLEQNATAVVILDEVLPLSVMEPGPSARRDAFYEHVCVTPLFEIPRQLLPEDLRRSAYTVVVKNEGDQVGNAYKFRGNTNAIQRSDHLPTALRYASTGNHANTGTLAGLAHGIEDVEVECPWDVAVPKLLAMLGNGAVVNAIHQTLPEALEVSKEAGQQPGALFVHPYDDLRVVSGQGTLSCEIFSQLKDLGLDGLAKTFAFPGGGGGIGSANAVVSKYYDPRSVCLISQMQGAEGIMASLEGWTLNSSTMEKACDGAAVPVPGELPMQIMADTTIVDGVDSVTMAEVGEAMAVLSSVQRVPEPAGALSLALAFKRMRACDLKVGVDAPELMVTVTSGCMVTPETVRKFMSAALREGLITGRQAGDTASKAYAERMSWGMQEIASRAIAAAANKPEDRNDDTTRLKKRKLARPGLSGPTAEYRTNLVQPKPTA